MSRYIQFNRFGAPDVLEYVERPTPSPAPGEVLIASEAIGVSWNDILWRQNLAQPRAKLPAGLGSEVAGTVLALGADVTGVKEGDRVTAIPTFDSNQYACYGEHVVLPREALIPFPDTLAPIEACVHYTPLLTGWLALKVLAGLMPGDTVLITSACHVDGPYMVQLARALGARVIATTPLAENIDYLHSVGAEAVIHTETQDLVQGVEKLTDGRGVEIVLDAMGGPQMSLLGEVLTPRGQLILIGLKGGNHTMFPAQQAFRKNLRFHVHCLSHYTGKPEQGIPRDHVNLAHALADIDRLTEEGKLSPQLDCIFDFAQAAEAHRYLEKCANHLGRIALRAP